MVTDADFDPDKQISDITDLINQGCEAIIYWPVDDKAIEPGLEAAVAAGIPTVNVGGGYTDLPGIVSNAYIDQYELGAAGAIALAEALGGQGKIVSMLPIAGTTAAVDQDKALKDVLANYPDIELLDTENGDWNRAAGQVHHRDLAPEVSPDRRRLLARRPDVRGHGRGLRRGWPPGRGQVLAGRRVQRLAQVDRRAPREQPGPGHLPAGRGARGRGADDPDPERRGGHQGHPRALRCGTRPEDAVALYDAAAPEDSWANELPAEFLPQQ